MCSRLLIGTHGLEVDVGRWSGTAREDRHCRCCDAGVTETAQHFALECSARAQEIKDFRDSVESVVVDPQRTVADLDAPGAFRFFMDPAYAGEGKNQWYAHLLKSHRLRESPQGSPEAPAPQAAARATPMSPPVGELGSMRSMHRRAQSRTAAPGASTVLEFGPAEDDTEGLHAGLL